MKYHGEKNGAEFPREIYKTINRHHQFYHAYKRLPQPFQPRELISDLIFRKEEDGAMVLVFSPGGAAENPPGRSKVTCKTTRASSHGIIIIEPLSPSTCHVTYINKIDAGSAIPAYLVNRKSTDSLRLLPEMMVKYDRSKEVDAANAAAFIKYVHNNNNSINSSNVNSSNVNSNNVNSTTSSNSDDSNHGNDDDCHHRRSRIRTISNASAGSSAVVTAQKGLLKDVDVKETDIFDSLSDYKFMGWRTMPSSTRFQTMSLKYSEGDKVVTGKVVFRVSCSAAEALSRYWLKTSNEKLKAHQEENGNLPYEVLSNNEDIDDGDSRFRGRAKFIDASSQCQSQTIRSVVSLPTGFNNREFVSLHEWEVGETTNGNGTEGQSYYMVNAIYLKAASLTFILLTLVIFLPSVLHSRHGNLRRSIKLSWKNGIPLWGILR
jgi:hypothetical protein